LSLGVDSLKIEGRMKSEYYVGSVVRAYRNAIDTGDIETGMRDLNILESRGYTAGFFAGAPNADAQNYETRDSKSEYCAVGVIAEVHTDHVIMELRNEIKLGDEISFLLPGTEKISIVINDLDGKQKASAGQGNAVKIPMTDTSKFQPLILAYKRK
ncbi:MAG: U32 family peptidase C-terminal domain-containing protein, partial [Alphaproteobacteria bacterium]|nr:U32 family peptidase C-terminal domain-containing protein [Alphaproteobacteria bacterium]